MMARGKGQLGDKTVLDGLDAIALALASERGGWRVTGVDRIADAVALAERNRQRLGLSNAEFRQSSWFEALAGEPSAVLASLHAKRARALFDDDDFEGSAQAADEATQLARELHDGGRVGGLDGVEGGEVGHAGVAGRRVEGADLRITGEGGEQRVFAAAVAEHKGLHEPEAYAVALARSGPWPLRWSA